MTQDVINAVKEAKEQSKPRNFTESMDIIINIRDFVLLGDSHATIRYSFRSFVSNAWVRDTSEIKAIIKYGAYLMVHLFDNAKADVFTDLSSRVVVIKHSRNASVRMEGNVVVKEEYDYMD